MRADEFITEKEKLDEILPLITGAASLAGGAMSLAGGVAKGAGAVASGVGKGVGAAAKGIGKGIGKLAGGGAKKPQGTQSASDKAAAKQAAKQADLAKDKMLRPGQKVPLPTKQGQKAFKVTQVRGDEVEIENPDGNKSPSQPNKLVYKKDDLKTAIQ